jgi:hypothetical protein
MGLMGKGDDFVTFYFFFTFVFPSWFDDREVLFMRMIGRGLMGCICP